jgi:hypothetical protein
MSSARTSNVDPASGRLRKAKGAKAKRLAKAKVLVGMGGKKKTMTGFGYGFVAGGRLGLRFVKRKMPGEVIVELTNAEELSPARVGRISVLAGKVFGDREKAQRWLSKPKRALGGKTPLSCLTDKSGEKIVENMLYQIDSGDVA